MSSRKECYDLLYKLKGMECAKKSFTEAAARELGVHVNRIHMWRSQREQLETMSKKDKAKNM